MKLLFAFLLSLIVLTETVVPCCLWDNCNEEETAASSHEADKKQKADCSPFAACATCTAVVLLSKPGFAVIVSPKLVLVHTAANPFFVLSSYQPSFLQPPRLV